jgi:hypothetical protein
MTTLLKIPSKQTQTKTKTDTPEKTPQKTKMTNNTAPKGRGLKSDACEVQFLLLTQLLTQKLLKQKLESSLQKLYGRHDDLVDCYEICISQMAMDLFSCTVHNPYDSVLVVKCKPRTVRW